MKVLVTGGAGYIGSVVCEELIEAGHQVVVYDNLSNGHGDAVVESAELVCADLADAETLRKTLSENIDAVIHLAAHSIVGESVENPAKYYRNNVWNGIVLLDAMRDAGVSRIVFSSTAAVYGKPDQQPITETARIIPTNPYGRSKSLFEDALRWYRESHSFRFNSLRYFNAAGASERFGEDHSPETHLIPVALEVAAGKRDFVEVFGEDYPTPDGTCVRDYIHVTDLARAHVLALDHLNDALSRDKIYNLGCGGTGYSVKQVLETVHQVTGKKISTRPASRRAGDPPVLIASSEKIKHELGWNPQYQDLGVIIETAWRWMQAHPDGYSK